MRGNRTRRPERDEERNTVSKVLFGIFNTDSVLRINSLDVDIGFAKELESVATETLADLDDLDEIPYDPSYRSLEGEYMRLSLDSAQGVSETIEMMEGGPHPIFSITGRGNLSGLRFYAFRFSGPNSQMWLFGRVGRTIVMKKSRLQGLLVNDGTKLKAVNADLVQLNRRIDFIANGPAGLILHVQNFHYIFNFYEKLRRVAKKNAETLSKKLPIENLEEFIEACQQQPEMALKLHQVVTHENWPTLPIERMFQLIDEENLPIKFSTKSGDRKLVFQPDPKHRWLILRLLADDILKSPVSARIFEATSKKSIPAG